MEKINAYQRKKDYSHLKDNYRVSRYKHKVKKNDVFISLEEKIGLQLVLCAIILTTLIVGKLFNINNITKFEDTISETISNNSFQRLQNTAAGEVFVDLQNVIKEQINIETDQSTPIIESQEVQQIDKSEYEDTIIEKKY